MIHHNSNKRNVLPIPRFELGIVKGHLFYLLYKGIKLIHVRLLL